MDISEFGWHLVGRPGFPLSGLHLRRAGANGVLFASVAGMEGEPWVAVVGLHFENAVPARLQCVSEAEAIERVEQWLGNLLVADAGPVSEIASAGGDLPSKR